MSAPFISPLIRRASPLPRRQRRAIASYVHRLEDRMLRLSPKDWLRVRDLLESVLILGATGSGKSSGSAALIARAMLRAGWGGLVLCGKPGEADRWEHYARQTGRANSIIRFDASGQFLWDFLAYEMCRWPNGSAVVFNVVALLIVILKAINGETGQAAQGSEVFWQKAVREALYAAATIVYAAYGTLDLDLMMAVLQSPPSTPGAIDDPAWQQGAMGQALAQAFDAPAQPLARQDFLIAQEYLTRTLANPDRRTSGNLMASISADLAPLRQGLLRALMGSGQTNIVPEVTHHGAIVLVDLALKQWDETGRLAAHIWKYCWQRAAERRPVTETTRPLFFFVDEAQLFLSPYDAEFLSTSREARVATVYITQNLPALYEKMGGRNPHDATDALLGNFQTKIFHANGDIRTNQFAADLIGKNLQQRRSWGDNVGGNFSETASTNSSSSGGGSGKGSWSSGSSRGQSGGWSHGENQSFNEQMDYVLQPSHFTGLRKGGRSYDGLIDAVIVQGGRRWVHSRAPWLQVEFKQ